MYRNGICEKYRWQNIEKRADEILQGLSVSDVCRIADEFIDSLPDDMPKFTYRRRHKLAMAKLAIIGKIERFEFV